MFQTWTIKLIAEIAMSLVISLALYAGYNHIKQIGRDEATAVCQARQKEADAKLDVHIQNLEMLSTSIVKDSQDYNTKVSKGIKDILNNMKTTYTIVDGKCAPSPAFTDAYNKIIRKANE